MVQKQYLFVEKIFNANESGLYWLCLPRTTIATADEKHAPGFKEAKDLVTVLVCGNATGLKCKPLVIGKSSHPRAFKKVKHFPMIYVSSKNAWIQKMFQVV